MRNTIMKVQESLKEMGTLLLVGLDKEIVNLLQIVQTILENTIMPCFAEIDFI